MEKNIDKYIMPAYFTRFEKPGSAHNPSFGLRRSEAGFFNSITILVIIRTTTMKKIH